LHVHRRGAQSAGTVVGVEGVHVSNHALIQTIERVEHAVVREVEEMLLRSVRPVANGIEVVVFASEGSYLVTVPDAGVRPPRHGNVAAHAANV
jgi:hypothetical protein